ncbi:MAG TPA: hypothetical protein PK006_13475, partial [Saprospiraceae bacterium]|nr:hypothetical protein [Saprospiraceae bacterium]
MNKAFCTLVFTLLVFHCSGVYAQWIGAKTYKEFPNYTFYDIKPYKDGVLMYRLGFTLDSIFAELYDANFNPVFHVKPTPKNQTLPGVSRNPLYEFISIGIDDPNPQIMSVIEQRDKNLQLIKRFPVEQTTSDILCQRIIDDSTGYIVVGNIVHTNNKNESKQYIAKLSYDGQQLWRKEFKLDSSPSYFARIPFICQVAPDEFVYTSAVLTRTVPNDITTSQSIPILIRFKSDGTILFQGTKFEFVKYTYNYNVDTLGAASYNTIHHLNAALPDKGFAVL